MPDDAKKITPIDFPTRVEKRPDVIYASEIVAKAQDHSERRGLVTDDVPVECVQRVRQLGDNFLYRNIAALAIGDTPRDYILKAGAVPVAPNLRLLDVINAQSTILSQVVGMDAIWGTNHAQELSISADAYDITQEVLYGTALSKDLPPEMVYWINGLNLAGEDGKVTECAYLQALFMVKIYELIEKKIPGIVSESSKRLALHEIAEETPHLLGAHDITMLNTPGLLLGNILRNTTIVTPNYDPTIVSLQSTNSVSVQSYVAQGIPLNKGRVIQKSPELATVLDRISSQIPNDNMADRIKAKLDKKGTN